MILIDPRLTNAPHDEGSFLDRMQKLVSLFQPTDALEMACHFLRPLQTFAAGEIETHLLAFEVFVRRDKILLMLQSIKRAHDLDPHHPVLHFQKSLFVRKCTLRMEFCA